MLESYDLENTLPQIQHRDLGGNDCSYSSSRASVDDRGVDGSEVDRDERAERLSPFNLLCLTISMGGLQTIWTAIMSQGSPYLSSLGMDSALISLVWLGGPLAGMFVQPYIGVLSDACTHSWGRRRPFIAVGTVLTVTCMIALPWTSDSVRFLCKLFKGDPNGRMAILLTQFISAVWIWAMKISVQPIQCGVRALIVDHCPSGQQVQASAYASMVVGIGSIVGYITGFVELPVVVPWLGNTQFKGLCVISSLLLSFTAAIQCFTIIEKKGVPNTALRNRELGFFGALKQVLVTIEAMPEKIRTVCMIQFFAWLGWFPFLYYITKYIGDLYRQEAPHGFPVSSAQNPEYLLRAATRYGTLSMVFFATTAFIVNLSLPYLVFCSNDHNLAASLEDTGSVMEKEAYFPKRGHPLLRRLTNNIHLNFALLTVRRAWACSHILSSAMLLCIGITKNRVLATFLITTLGISWALTQWAPFALIGVELAKSPIALGPKQRRLSVSDNAIYTSLAVDDEDDKRDIDLEKSRAGRVDSNIHAGGILGVHNIAIAMPQIAAAVGGGVLFWILARCGILGVDAMGWMLAMSALPAAVAAWLTIRMDED